MPDAFRLLPDGTLAHYQREWKDYEPGVEWLRFDLPSKRASWHFRVFAFTLIIEHRPEEANPFFGTIKATDLVLREFYSWPTIEQAVIGTMDWALAELSKEYHAVAKARAGG